MHTYSFEIVVPQVKDADGVELKPAARIDHGEGLLERPEEADLLQDAHDALKEAGRKASEASVNIRPFC